MDMNLSKLQEMMKDREAWCVAVHVIAKSDMWLNNSRDEKKGADFIETYRNRVGLLWWLNGKESACQYKRYRFDPWVGKILWRRKQQPPPIFLPEKSHGQRSLVGYSPWGNKESDTTNWLNNSKGNKDGEGVVIHISLKSFLCLLNWGSHELPRPVMYLSSWPCL